MAPRSMAGRDWLRVMDAAKAKPKPFDYVLVDDTSRFGRNKADTFKNRDILRFYKVHLYFVEDGLDSSDLHFAEVSTTRLFATKIIPKACRTRSGALEKRDSWKAITQVGIISDIATCQLRIPPGRVIMGARS